MESSGTFSNPTENIFPINSTHEVCFSQRRDVTEKTGSPKVNLKNDETVKFPAHCIVGSYTGGDEKIESQPTSVVRIKSSQMYSMDMPGSSEALSLCGDFCADAQAFVFGCRDGYLRFIYTSNHQLKPSSQNQNTIAQLGNHYEEPVTKKYPVHRHAISAICFYNNDSLFFGTDNGSIGIVHHACTEPNAILRKKTNIHVDTITNLTSGPTMHSTNSLVLASGNTSLI